MVTAAPEKISDRLVSCKTLPATESMLSILHEHHVTACDDEVMTQESARKMREAYKAFGLKCPR